MKTEKALSIVFIISLIFKLMHWPGAGPLMVLSLLGLGLCYFPFGFYFFSDKNLFVLVGAGRSDAQRDLRQHKNIPIKKPMFCIGFFINH